MVSYAEQHHKAVVFSDMEQSASAYLTVSDAEGNGQPLWPDPQLHAEAVECLRRKLKYFFMNPCEKYEARGRKPWKLIVQILKIVLVTTQLVTFGLSNEMVVTFKEDNLMAFRHLFLKNDVDSDASTYSLYTQEDVYEHIVFIVERFLDLRNTTTGNHAHERNAGAYTPLRICQEFYKNGSISPANETFDIDTQVEEECIEVYPMQSRVYPLNFTLPFKRLLLVNVVFTLKAINLQTVQHHELPDCYDFTITISFNNRAHSGRIKVYLDNDVDINECRDWNVTGASAKNVFFTLAFDIVIILTCVGSCSLCIRSVINGLLLQLEYVDFCSTHQGKRVPWSDRMEFVNGWYILIIVSDSLTLSGSFLKMEIMFKNVTSYDVCSILLGTGTMLVWVGVLRYMGFFKKYNILVITLRAALPNVIRFCCCASMIYLGYCFCGWIVLGPYHEKFRTMNTVSECLFSLINGDDMYPTFKDMQQKSYLVWLFSRVYLYTFVSLFIYMVLSLFITLITDTYETIKQQQQDGVHTSELHAFISQCCDHPNSGHYRINDRNALCVFCCPNLS